MIVTVVGAGAVCVVSAGAVAAGSAGAGVFTAGAACAGAVCVESADCAKVLATDIEKTKTSNSFVKFLIFHIDLKTYQPK